MTDQVKKEISEAAKAYTQEKGISLNELARRADINQAYLSKMLNLDHEKIAEKWFSVLAKTIGYPLDVVYWDHVSTPQYKAVVSQLEEARESGRNRILIGDTGCGKTYAINRYITTRPLGTFKVTVSSLHSIHILLGDLMNAVGLEPCGTPVTRLRSIAHKLSMFQLEGLKPLIIIDECENMKSSAFGMIKSLYDHLEGVCPVVLMGTSQIKHKITNMLKLNKTGMPQFYRRFVAGERYLPAIDRTFRLFIEETIEDPKLKTYLRRICNNYGELHDYLELAIRESDRLGVPLSYGFFCEIHGIKDQGVRL